MHNSSHPYQEVIRLPTYKRKFFNFMVVVVMLIVVAITIREIHLQQVKSSHAASLYSAMTINGVAINNSSAKILFQPVIGAADYRVYDVTNPNDVKYAGMKHIDLTVPPLGWQGTYKLVMQPNGLPQIPFLYSTSATGPQKLDLPNPEIEWNGLGDHQPHTLIVQAVDALGPVPQANLYDINNLPLLSILRSGAMLGSDKGSTADGKTSTNGQGPFTNNPQVIAQSQPFVVQAAASSLPLPTKPDATQIVLDTFDQNEATSLVPIAKDLQASTMSYTLNAGTSKTWSLLWTHADVKDSMPFIASDHFMDMLFDAGTPGTNNPLHQGHGEMGMTPEQTIDFSNGRMAHITMEVDGHMSSRRWLSMALTPATDPFTSFDPQTNVGFNATDQALFLQFFPEQATLGFSRGPTSSTDKTPLMTSLWGAAGQAPIGGYDSSDLGGNGLAFDDRSRYDFFLTQTHAVLFKDGELIQNSDIAGGLPFTQAKVYYIHYTYHTDQEENTAEADLTKGACYPMNAFWYNNPQTGIIPGDGTNGTDACGLTFPAGFGFRYSDERHWDNMGFEVLPSTDVPTDFNTLSSLVQPIAYTPPTYVSNTAIPTILPTTPPLSTTPTITPVLLIGDINGDGHVDVADLSILADNFGLSGTTIKNIKADINSNGIIDVADLSLLADHFGQ